MNFANKKLVGYGTGITMLGTIETFPLDFEYFIEDNEALVGQQIMESPINSIETLKAEKPGAVFVVIFASNYQSTLKIKKKLIDLDMQEGEDFIDCFEIHYLTIAEKLDRVLNVSADYKLLQKVKQANGEISVPNLSTPSGTWLFCHLLRKTSYATDGDIAECGVYYGGNALITHLVLPEITSRHYHLFDSFEGFGSLSTGDPVSRSEDFRDNSFEYVQNLFQDYPNVKFHKGFFQETFEQMEAGNFALVYIDCDLYEPTIDCLNYFSENLASGGMILIHDYWYPGVERPKGSKAHFEGIKKAVDEFSTRDENFDPLIFPETTHCLLIKR